MLEKLPRGIGHALRGVRAGYEKIIAEDDAFAQTPDTITLESAAFADGGDIPDRFTADGDQMLSPPLTWRGVAGRRREPCADRRGSRRAQRTSPWFICWLGTSRRT